MFEQALRTRHKAGRLARLAYRKGLGSVLCIPATLYYVYMHTCIHSTSTYYVVVVAEFAKLSKAERDSKLSNQWQGPACERCEKVSCIET